MNRRPRILYILTPAIVGGAPRHVVDLIASLKHLYDVGLVVGEEGYAVEAAQKLGVQVQVLASLKRNISPLNDLQAVIGFWRMVKQFKPNLIHAHTFKAGFVGRLVGASLGIPVVYTPHGWNFAPGAPRLWQQVVPPIEKGLALLTNQVICVSQDEKNLALSRHVVTPEKIQVIHNGVADVSIRAQANNADNPVIVVMIARFATPKTPEVLIQASAQLGKKVQVWLVGEGPSQESAKLLTRQLGLEDRIRFLGDQRDIPEILSQAHILALSSDWEGLPLTVLEGMRAGLPVVASDVGGIGEAVTQGITGFLVPARDIKALQEALQRLIVSPQLRQEIGQAARRHYEAAFSLDQQIEKTLVVYKSVLSS